MATEISGRNYEIPPGVRELVEKKLAKITEKLFDDVIDVLHALPPTDPDEPVLVAGEPEEIAREQRLREGVPVPDALSEKIRAICERSGAPFVLRAD